jgi:hypothetical protein
MIRIDDAINTLEFGTEPIRLIVDGSPRAAFTQMVLGSFSY